MVTLNTWNTMEGKTISTRGMIREVISKLGLRDVQDLPYYDIMIWMGQALQHIGGYNALETTKKKVRVENYTGRYPEDLHAILYVDGHPRFKSIRNGFQIDLKEGSVWIEYERFPLDEDGFPTFPSDISTKEAITWYIAKYLSIQGKLPNKNLSPNYCDQQWQWYCGQARAEGYVPTPDQWERMINVFYRMVPTDYEYANRFIGLNDREVLHRDSNNPSPSIFR